MKLWLLRHGQAHVHAASDAERELTEHGRDEVRQSAEHLQASRLSGIFVSPYIRAQQTAELIRQALGFTQALRTVPWLTPDSDTRECLSKLDRMEEGEILLVSHQPFIGALGGLLVHGHRQSPLPMQTASLALLEADAPLAGLMELRLLTHPDLH